MAQLASTVGDLPGSRIGRFVIRGKLGYGGIGEVFLAEDTVLKRLVALKAIKPERTRNSRSRNRLLKEAVRASQLNNEHIVQVHDVVEHQGNLLVVMEYVEGQTLRACLKNPLSHDQFFSIAEQCLLGLEAAHACRILHCDLKPENLMVSPSGQVKILDFGFARRVETDETQDSSELFSSGVIGGTMAYMAPEVLMGRKPDQRSDIFSLGVVFSESLTGCHPFRTKEAGATAGQILENEPQALPATVPKGLDAVIARMLAKDPSQRYPNCRSVLTDIGRVRVGQQPVFEVAVRPNPRRMSPWLAVLATLLIAAAWLIGRHDSHPLGLPTVTASTRQLVVLPFKPASDDVNSHAFSNGLTETLAAKLGQIADRYPLEIAPASEVKAQKVNDAQQARAIMGANLVLEGSMQQAGNTVRVTYSLVDTRNLRLLHSGVVTADVSNPFAVQDRVIDEVLSSLDIELGKQDRGRMRLHGTTQPQSYEAYLSGRGYLQDYDRLDSLDNAIAAFQRSLQFDSGFALAYAGLGQAYLHRGALTHSTESLARAEDACMQAVKLDNSAPDAEICLGLLFKDTGEYEKAAQHLERAIEADSSRDESYRVLAQAYEKLGRIEDAESLLKRAVAARPQYWAGYKYLGKFYDTRGRYAEAIEQFKRVVELAPDSYSGYYSLGGVYLHQGDYAAGITELERSIAIRPTAQAFSNLGVAYFYERRYADAARNYELAAQMLPGMYFIFGNLGEAYAQIEGKQEESRKNYAHALELAERGLAANPRDNGTLMNAALYAARLGQNTKAEKYRKKGLQLAPVGPEIRMGSALVLVQLHQDKAALAELERALHAGLSPSDATNNPAWARFAVYPEFKAMLSRAQSRK